MSFRRFRYKAGQAVRAVGPFVLLTLLVLCLLWFFQDSYVN